MAEAIVFAASTVSSGLMCRNARVWYMHARTSLVTCWLNVNVESSDTRNNCTASANATVLPATLTPPFSVWPHLFCGAGHEKKRGKAVEVAHGI